MAAIRLRPIGVVRSCFTGGFGIPRQPRLVPAAEARVVLLPEFAREEAFKGLEGFSHVWLVFLFHASAENGWRPTVRPPRLGGRRKVGVFASRSPHRPNPIGISAVERIALERNGPQLALRVRGVDLLDGTPVLDIKPYVPYADAIPDARGGFAPEAPAEEWQVEYAPDALHDLLAADPDGRRRLQTLIEQILRQDPRPGYMDRYPERDTFGMRLYELNIRWRVAGRKATVIAIEPAERAPPPPW